MTVRANERHKATFKKSAILTLTQRNIGYIGKNEEKDGIIHKPLSKRQIRKSTEFTLNGNQAVKMDVQGLPDGYSGLMFVVAPNFEAGTYEPMRETIAPSSTAHGRDHETIWVFVWPDDEEYNCCGWFIFDCLPDRVVPDNADVALAHQKRGIASSVYRFVRRTAEIDLFPSIVQSNAATAFWKKLAPNSEKL